MTSGTEVPVVGGLGPSPIRCHTVNAVLESIGGGLTKEVLCCSGGIVSENGKSTKGEATVANAIPVTRDIVRPPPVDGVASVEDGHTRPQSPLDHVSPHLLLLVVG